jgi:hypothetical protein
MTSTPCRAAAAGTGLIFVALAIVGAFMIIHY